MKKNNDDYKSVDKDFYKLIEELSKDIKVLEHTIKEDDNQTWRRAYVRAVFSSIESIIFNMKRFIKVIEKHDYLPLSETERKKLDEYYIEKSTNGKELIKVFRLSFLNNIIFTIELFAYANYVSMKVNKKSAGWKLLKESVKIRNRITHPKSSSDINLKKSELNKVYRAHKWFIDMTINLHFNSYKALMAQVNGLKKAFAKNLKST